ncbi:MAG: hypothetical protein Q7S33_04780 [Nanoarchaeota archaeon]|nr:hypothetical protein [Nanoarchaeota archaeon]
MFWNKNKKLVDIRAAERMGMVRTPQTREVNLKTDREGFVDSSQSLNSNTNISSSGVSSPARSSPASNGSQSNSTDSKSGFFSFFDSTPTSSVQTSSNQRFSTEKEGYSKVEVDIKMEELDNKIYKLEQRIELIERKVGVGTGW